MGWIPVHISHLPSSQMMLWSDSDRVIAIDRVRMRRYFWYRLIEKYFEQLIDSVRVLRPHCCNSKANDFQRYCAAACAGICQAHMRCTVAIGESVNQIWRNIFVYF